MHGTHHASGIVPSAAPTRIAIFSPSPVFVFTDTGWVIGPRTKLRTRSRSHSKPPVASTTPPRTPTSNPPSGASNRTPTTRPPSVISSWPAAPGTRLDPAVEAALQQAPDEPLPGAALVVDLAPLQLLRRHTLRVPRDPAASRSS